eukprot:COSAG01_NODE_29040_length_647_cov_0.640511_1_plen_31_part_10
MGASGPPAVMGERPSKRYSKLPRSSVPAFFA